MIADRGVIGRMQRFPTLNLESYHDFLTGFRQWLSAEYAPGVIARANTVTEGIGEDLVAAPPSEAIIAAVEKDPSLAAFVRTWVACQQMAHQSLVDELDGRRDFYTEKYSAPPNAAVGSLALNPSLEIPDYARHEIHTQPGGYVGYEFAGVVYYYSTMSFYRGRNDQNELYTAGAAGIPTPDDGIVERILDLGCGIGQLTIALKERFPASTVTGLDVGAPMLTFAHTLAVHWGIDVNFIQGLAEDTGFADGSFDIVTVNIVFHEVPISVTHRIVAEALRILRPGGIFYVKDFYTKKEQTRFERYMTYSDHVYNNEKWAHEFKYSDFVEIVKSVGFKMRDSGEKLQFLCEYIFEKPS